MKCHRHLTIVFKKSIFLFSLFQMKWNQKKNWMQFIWPPPDALCWCILAWLDRWSVLFCCSMHSILPFPWDRTFRGMLFFLKKKWQKGNERFCWPLYRLRNNTQEILKNCNFRPIKLSYTCLYLQQLPAWTVHKFLINHHYPAALATF